MRIASAVALLAAGILAGCTPVGPIAAAGGLHAWTDPTTVRIGLWEEPHSLDPVVGTMSFEDDVDQLEFDGLIRYDDRGHAIPDLAREVPSLKNGGVSRDGLTITYHLMPNARWHDGVPVTSADVLYTWQQIMNPKNNVISQNGYDRIVSIDTPDPHTVRIHLRMPYAPAVYLFSDGGDNSIVPRHVLSRYATLNETPFDAHPVGSGPYIFRSWTHGSEMRFDANPNYFRGAPKIPHVVLRFIPDQNTLVNSLRAHDVDVYYLIDTNQVPVVRALPAIRFTSTASLFAEGLVFDTQRPPMNDVRVRLALCYAFDEKRIFDTIYHGLGGQGPTLMARGLLGYNPAIHYYPYDPKKAAALLDAAGWKLGPDGMRVKDGKPLAFDISSVAGAKLREQIEVQLQHYWQALGADVGVKNYTASTLFATVSEGGPLYTGHTDVAIYTGGHAFPDPDVENTLAPDRLPPAGQNASRYQNAELGRLLKAGLASYDPAVREPIYRRIGQIEIENVPTYVLDWEPKSAASNIDLHGLRPNPVTSDLWNIADWRFGP